MVNIVITNTREFERELRRKIIPRLGFALERNIRSIARSDAFDTGAFHNSIMFDEAESQKEKAAVVQDRVPYGIFLEFGTVKLAPRAIFQRGMNITLLEVPELLKNLT